MKQTGTPKDIHALVRCICEIAILTGLIHVSGLFRIPGFLPGSEFQLSAPIAVAICGVFGFKKYIIAGVLASCIGLMLGTSTLFNVLIAMTFRLGTGAVWLLLGSHRLFYVLAGPVGTALARFVLSLLVEKGFWIMLSAAAPGMLYTAATAWFFGKLFQKCRNAVVPESQAVKKPLNVGH